MRARRYVHTALPMIVTPSAPPPQSALKQVATRSTISFAPGDTTHYMVRRAHYARDNISACKVAFPHCWVLGTGSPVEVIGTGTMTVTASIEYPAGTFTQLTFSGSATGSCPPGQALLWSDSVQLGAAIPNGAQFWVRFFWFDSVAIPYMGGGLGMYNEGASTGDAIVSAGTDQTMSGTVTGNTAISMSDCAIVGLSIARAIGIAGDSRQAGLGDLVFDASGDLGEIGRAIGPSYAYINLARASATATQFGASNSMRLALAQYCDTIIDAHGINDLSTGTTAQALEALVVANRAVYGANITSYYQCTLPPETTSTDFWATTTNQTVAAWDAQRVAYNTWVRANTGGFTRTLDIASFVESALNSGKWKADGTANKYTGDGVHEKSFANQQIVISLP